MPEEKPKPHITEKKKKQVREVENLVKEYPVIGIVDMTNLPCAQLQMIKRRLKDHLRIYMTKKRLMKIALEDLKKEVKGIEKLENYLEGIPALMFTREDPFRIFSRIKKNKTPAAAKAGQTAPKDLIIPAGPTEFGPGPIVGELGALGVKAGIEQGKVAIKSDFMAARKGDVISEKVANLLSKFNIKPMEIGLDVTAIFENGDILAAETLDIDEKEYFDSISKAAAQAFNLSVEAGILTKENIELLVTKAFSEAKSLAIEQGILEKEVVGLILARAVAQASALKNKTNV